MLKSNTNNKEETSDYLDMNKFSSVKNAKPLNMKNKKFDEVLILMKNKCLLYAFQKVIKNDESSDLNIEEQLNKFYSLLFIKRLKRISQVFVNRSDLLGGKLKLKIKMARYQVRNI